MLRGASVNYLEGDYEGALTALAALLDRADLPATEQERAGVRPEGFALHPNFPNPFNPRTTIRFALPESGPVRLTVYDVLGRQVRLLADQSFSAGVHDLPWDGRDQDGRTVGSGVYFYRIDASAWTQRRKMLLLR